MVETGRLISWEGKGWDVDGGMVMRCGFGVGGAGGSGARCV